MANSNNQFLIAKNLKQDMLCECLTFSRMEHTTMESNGKILLSISFLKAIQIYIFWYRLDLYYRAFLKIYKRFVKMAFYICLYSVKYALKQI